MREKLRPVRDPGAPVLPHVDARLSEIRVELTDAARRRVPGRGSRRPPCLWVEMCVQETVAAVFERAVEFLRPEWREWTTVTLDGEVVDPKKTIRSASLGARIAPERACQHTLTVAAPPGCCRLRRPPQPEGRDERGGAEERPKKAPKKAPTDPLREPPKKAPEEPPKKAPTEPPTKAPKKAPRKAPEEPPKKAPTEPPRKGPEDSPTEPLRKGPEDSPKEPATKALEVPPTMAPRKGPRKAKVPKRSPG